MPKQTYDPNRAICEMTEDNIVKVVTESCELQPNETMVDVHLGVAPIAITLPPVAAAFGKRVFIRVVSAPQGAAHASVVCKQDGLRNLAVGDDMSAINDFICVDNLAGNVWSLVDEVTT